MATTKSSKGKVRKQARTKATPKRKKAPTKTGALKAIQGRYPHVSKVVQTGKRGQATRVVISCQASYDNVDCEKTREIATQDAFQVRRCHACQREYLKRRRRRGAPENPASAAA